MICVQEDGRYNDNRFKLSYFDYPLTPLSKPCNVYEAKDDEWTYEYMTRQVNNHSMLAWFKSRHDIEWEFKTYDLRDDPSGKYNVYTFKQQIGVAYNLANVQCALTTMWQTTKNCFMMCTITNKGENEKNKDMGVIQNNYICDTTMKIVRQAKCTFG